MTSGRLPKLFWSGLDSFRLTSSLLLCALDKLGGAIRHSLCPGARYGWYYTLRKRDRTVMYVSLTHLSDYSSGQRHASLYQKKGPYRLSNCCCADRPARHGRTAYSLANWLIAPRQQLVHLFYPRSGYVWCRARIGSAGSGILLECVSRS